MPLNLSQRISDNTTDDGAPTYGLQENNFQRLSMWAFRHKYIDKNEDFQSQRFVFVFGKFSLFLFIIIFIN